MQDINNIRKIIFKKLQEVYDAVIPMEDPQENSRVLGDSEKDICELLELLDMTRGSGYFYYADREEKDLKAISFTDVIVLNILLSDEEKKSFKKRAEKCLLKRRLAGD